MAYFFRNINFLKPYLNSMQPLSVYLTALPFAIIILLTVFGYIGLYGKSARTNPFEEGYVILKGITLWLLIIMSGSYLYKYNYSRIIILLFGLSNLFLASAGRWLVRIVETRLKKKGIGLTKVLILGSGEKGRTIAEQLSRQNSAGIRVLGFLDNKIGTKTEPALLGTYDDLFEVIKKYDAHEVYITDDELVPEKILNLLSLCPHNVRFLVATNLFRMVLGDNANLYDADEIPVIDLGHSKPSQVYFTAKRALDIIISIIGLFLTIPFWPIIALLIKIDSPGKAVIKQNRVGFKEKIFKMYKFRTMHAGVDFYSPAPRDKKDLRVTRVGKFLRKTSLDELPQLWNVLKGDMSMVGPRPEMTFIVERYKPWQKKRLEVKPGLTGLWQILGRKDLPLEENLQYDFYYINNQSLLLDLTIILKTIPYVILEKGAY